MGRAMAEFDRIPEQALEWLAAGKGAALATVVETWGSAPRPAGAQLAISEDAEIAGSVSGGCVEGAVVEEALELLRTGETRLLEFGVSNEEAFAVGLACGGTIRILIEPVGRGTGPARRLIGSLAEARAQRRAVAYRVNLVTWERELRPPPGGDDDALQARFDADRSGRDGDWFSAIHNPPLRLIVVGGVHIAQPLVRMARMAGYDPVIIDPRDAFASPERFPGERLIHDWPDRALAAERPDARTAVVTLTHDPKLDDPAIRAALETGVFYLGCLGSRRTHARRVARLEAAGVPAEQIARIHAPVGTDIGARSPAEIAVAIIAEITERLRRPETRPPGRGA